MIKQFVMTDHLQAGEALVGRTLQARFEVLRVLNTTSHVTACLGKDLANSGARIVIKCASAARVAAASLLRLEHEAAILSSLGQSAIGSILHVGREQEVVYLVTPFVPGISLEERLAAGRLSCDEVIQLAEAMAKALTEVHAHGVLHRDIKPSNIIINPQGLLERATLIDFGQAHHMVAKLPLGEALAFTALYAAPEQTGLIHQGVDERSDLYALGIVLYEALAGQPPFHAAELNEVLIQHLSWAPPPLRAQVADVPAVVEELIARLLAKDPRDRYQSAASLAHDLSVIAAARRRGESDPALVLGKWDRRSSLTEPSFVGRHTEKTKLKSLLQEASSGQGRVIKLTAPSGAGKSRLLAELARQAQADGLLVLQGQGFDHTVSRPYQMLSSIARGLVEASSHDQGLAVALRRQLREHASTLAALLPALQALLLPEETPSSNAPLPEALAEARNVQAIAALFAALGTPQRSALLLFDDAQWGDKASLKLLQDWQVMMTEANTQQRYATLILAARSDDPASEQALRHLQFSHTVALAPLSDLEVAKLLQSMAGPLPPGVINRLTELAAHNPFMATALLRGMVESGALQPGEHGWTAGDQALASLQSSRRAAALLTQRLESLSADAQAFLSVAALLGKSFDIAAAIDLAGCSAGTAMATVALARSRHMLWEERQSGRYSFVHDKLREALMARLPAARQRALHLRAAERLEEEGASEEDLELAYHFDAAGESTRACPYALRAAAQARRQSALAEAEQQYRIAERGLHPTQVNELATIAQGLGDVLMLQGQYQEAGLQMERAKELATSVLQRAQIQVSLGELASKRGDMEAAVAALSAGLVLLGQRVPRRNFVLVLFLVWEILVQALHTLRLGLNPTYVSKRALDDKAAVCLQIYSRLWYAYWFMHGPAAFGWAHLRNMNMAERYEESSHLAQTYCDHAAVASAVPYLKRGRDYSQRSLAIRRRRHDQWGEGQSLNWYSSVLYVGSQFEEALANARAALPILERTGDRWQCTLVKWGFAHYHYRLGNLQAAVEACREVYEESIAIGDFSTSGIVLSIWAMASHGQVPPALLVQEQQRDRKDPQRRAGLKLAEGVQHLYAGEHARAIAACSAALAIVQQAKLRNEYVTHVGLWLMTALRSAADALDHLDPRRHELMVAAKRLWRPSLKLARSFRNNLPHALREGAFIAAWQGRPHRAQARIAASLALASQQKAQHEYALSLGCRGRLGTFFAWPGAAEDCQQADTSLRQLTGAAPGAHSEPSLGTRGDLSILARFEIVLEGGHRIITALSTETIFEAVCSAAEKLFRSERCLVLAAVPAADTFSVVAGNPQQAFSRTLITQALAKGGALAVDESTMPTVSDSLLLADVRSALCVPILKHQEPVACLYVSHPLVGQLFHNAELKLGQFLAVLAGAALENAESFGKLQAINSSLAQLAAERKQVAVELQQAKDAADASNRAKSQFLANMSHEMRTPLVTILGFSHFLATPDLSPDEAAQFLATIDRNGDLLTRLIDDVLDLTKAETGQLKIDPVPIKLAEFLQGVEQGLDRQAIAKGLRLSVQASSPLPETITTDPTRLRQLLFHIAGNAIKFTARGSVEILVSLVKKPSPHTGPELRFVIKDSGCGIAPDMQGKLFQAFTQADPSHTRSFGGSGIGLYLSRKLAKALGGQVALSASQPDQGSTFTITIDPGLADAPQGCAAPQNNQSINQSINHE